MSEAVPRQAIQLAGPKGPSNQEWPFVSVVIPVKNDAQRLTRCLVSLARQRWPADRFEVIVVDNGSTDESAAAAEAHGARVLVHPGLRVGALRNRGVEIARGSILVFVDSDHEAPDDWLRLGVQELMNDDGILMIGSPYLAPSDCTWVQLAWELHCTRGNRRRAVEWLGGGNMFLRRRDFQEVHGFNEHLIAAEDVDLCVRLARLPGRIISDLRLANIHHGEARTLIDFVRKEYWRGSSGIVAFVSHGMPLRELPSLLYPLYHLVSAATLVLAIAGLFWNGSVRHVTLALLALALPALVMGAATSWQLRSPSAMLSLSTLYLAYGLARAAALGQLR